MRSKLKWIFAAALFAVMAVPLMYVTGCSRSAAAENASTNAPQKTLYTCGMHPWIIQDHPGNCPICGMKLEPVHKTAETMTGPAKIKFYKSTMNPGETSPVPGKDSMGMEMVPVYADEAAAANSSAIAIDPATIQMMN